MARFVRRDRELRLLEGALDRVRHAVGSATPGQCLLVRGRRRVGKSRLAEAFVDAAGVPTLYFTASRQATGVELRFFAEEAATSSLPGAALFAGVALDSWDAALRLLAAALPVDQPAVVVVDELPYLLEDDPAVEATFQKQWDRLLSRKPVLLLLIGSDISLMELLDTHGRAFHQRGRAMVVPPLSPRETGEIVTAPSAADAFDAHLVTGGLPLVCAEWPAGATIWEYLAQAVADPTSALVVSAERVVNAEFPTEAQARAVLSQIGAGEATFTRIGRASGGLTAASANRSLHLLGAKRVVARELPLSTKASKEARYRVADPYLRFWLRFVGPHLAEIERGRGDRVMARITAGWTSWRGKAIEPVVREALARLLPAKGLPGGVVGAYWTRTNVPEIDVVGADRGPVAGAIRFVGSVKWLEQAAFDQGDLNELAAAASLVPGYSAGTPLVAVSRTRVTASGAVAFSPEELLLAW